MNPSFKLKYITGRSALNIPYKGVTHDWHQVDMFEKNAFSIHPINFRGAELILGNAGLRDETEFFLNRGLNVENVMVATPVRAIIDWLYFCIFRKNIFPSDLSLKELTMLEFDEKDKSVFVDMFSKLKKSATSKQGEMLLKWWSENQEFLK